jgi:hypothetical protein
MTTPFDFVNDLSFNKKNIFSEETESAYLPFIINRAFANFIDCIFYANEMNMHSDLPKQLQNDYYINILRKNRRFAKWFKKEKSTDLEAIKEYYGYNDIKASSALNILTKEELKEIKLELEERKT